MKLIDLLTRKLPENGGWPEGATEFHRHGVLEFEAYFYGEGGGQIGKSVAVPSLTCYCGDANGETVTREEYEAALAESKKLIWSGEGLPPVGTVCEFEDNEKWLKVEVVFSSKWVIVLRSMEKNAGCGVDVAIDLVKDKFADLSLRPIRTEAERRREESVGAMKSAALSSCQSVSDYQAIYDAIAAGKIPHITLK